ncbi:MBL fold metallo-hydrolase [Sulfolobales archaeon HS-7]|nr:MBL fold metallo-hydrolase [Sulfolobales archaeon HS-7]
MQLFDNVWMLKGMCNTYLTYDGYLIDSGTKADKILQFANSHNITIKEIMITHAHPDHIVDLKRLKDLTNAEIIAHEFDARVIEGKLPHYKIVGRLISSIMRQEKVKVDVTVKEGEKIGDIFILHTPGHTPGSVTYIYKNIAFTGDAVIEKKGNPSLSNSIFSWDRKMEKKSLLVLSAYKLDYLLPGHGNTISSEQFKKFVQEIN